MRPLTLTNVLGATSALVASYSATYDSTVTSPVLGSTDDPLAMAIFSPASQRSASVFRAKVRVRSRWSGPRYAACHRPLRLVIVTHSRDLPRAALDPAPDCFGVIGDTYERVTGGAVNVKPC
jgi:hypothetical protein